LEAEELDLGIEYDELEDEDGTFDEDDDEDLDMEGIEDAVPPPDSEFSFQNRDMRNLTIEIQWPCMLCRYIHCCLPRSR